MRIHTQKDARKISDSDFVTFRFTNPARAAIFAYGRFDVAPPGLGTCRRSGVSLASIHAIQSVGESLRMYLQSSYPSELRSRFPCTFQLLSSGQLARFEDPADSAVAVTLFLYRTTVNEQLRNRRRRVDGTDVSPALALDLHWMLTVWASNAQAEQTVYAWALGQLHLQPVFDAGLLTADGGWDASEVVQILPHELTLEEMLRVWEALEPSYRLSASYVARTVIIDPAAAAGPLPVVAARFSLGGGWDEEGA